MKIDLRAYFDRETRHPNRHDRRRMSIAAPTRRNVPVKKSLRKGRQPSNVLENKKKQFPRLSDPKYADTLRKEFTPYSDRAYTYYSIAAGVTAYLRAHLNDATIMNSYGVGDIRDRADKGQYGVAAGAGENTALPYGDYYKRCAQESAGGGGPLKIKGNEVQLALSPLLFRVKCRLTEETRPVILKKFTALFGKFTVPTQYSVSEETHAKQLVMEEFSSGLKPLAFFQRLKWPVDPAAGYFQPENLELDVIERKRGRGRPMKESGQRKVTAGDAVSAMAMEIKLIDARMDDYRLPYEEQTGPIRNYSVVFTLEATGVVTFPLEYALWSTGCEDMTEFVPKVLRDHFDQVGLMHVGDQSAGTYKSALYSRTMHVGIVKKINARNMQEYEIKVRPRVSTDNFTILSNGKIYYLPPEDRSDFYIDTLRKSWDTETGKIKRNSELREVHNLPLMVDWINDVFSYTNDSGQVRPQRLIGSIPLDDVTIAKELNKSLESYDSSHIGMIMSVGRQICVRADLIDRTGPFGSLNYEELFRHVFRNYSDLEWRRVAADAYTYTPENPGDIIKNQRDANAIKELIRLSEAVAKNWMKHPLYALSTRCENIFYFYLLGIYSRQGAKLWKTYNDSKAANTPIPEAELPTKFAIPNLPGIRKVLLHQATVLGQSLFSAPELMALDIAAGGGKCVVGDTLISTNQGILSIKELWQRSGQSVGDGFRKLSNILVRTSEGMLPATRSYSRKGRTIRVLLNDGTRFEGLPEHRLHDGRDFVRLDAVQPGQYFKKYLGEEIFGNLIDLPIQSNRYPSQLNSALAQLLGFIVAEGHNSAARAQLSITAHNPDNQTRILCLLTEIFQHNYEFKANSVHLLADHIHYINQLVKPVTSAHQEIPLNIRQTTRELQLEFLSALFEGDGFCYFENKAETETGRWHLGYGTISRRLAEQAKTLLENLGFAVQLNRKQRYQSANGNANLGGEITWRRAYELKLHPTQFVDFQQMVGFQSTEKSAALRQAINYYTNRSGQISNDEIFGLLNDLPQIGSYARLLHDFEQQLRLIEYPVQFGRQTRYCQLNVAAVYRFLGFGSHAYSQMRLRLDDKADRKLSKFHGRQLLSAIERLPELTQSKGIAGDKLQRIVAKLQNKIHRLQDDLSASWVRVKSVTQGKLQRVYDLVVPGPHDYLAYNVVSHNTFQLLADMLILLDKGKIKRPMIICPGGLVKEWTSEVNRASQGMVNVIPINVETIQRMVRYMHYDKKSYLKYLQNAPPNSVFVVGLSFLSGTKDHFSGESYGKLLQIGEQLIDFFPNVQLLRQLNPDYIGLDESHYAKNAKSQRTNAVQSLMPVAKYRRVASGTIVQNDPSDIPAQYGLLNPTIFGTAADFLDKFAVSQGGKFQRYLAGAERQLTAQRLPFAFRSSKTRRDWAHLLPIIRPDFIQDSLTPNQQAFYTGILRERLDQFRNDPKIRELLAKADEEKIKKLEKLLDKKLTVVEQFVNAPDFNPTFVNLQTTTPKDLVSPKVRRIDWLIQRHLTGHTDEQTGDIIAPDPNKIIIFGYNKVVSKHIWRHFSYQKIAVHYSIDGSEPYRGEVRESKMTAGEALLKFRNDPKVKIMVADETSLREGLNLQVASRVIRCQSLFAPGAQEQAMSRALRPDVDNVYGRENLYINWLVIANTIEVGKAARLIGKAVVKSRTDEADNPNWHNFVRQSDIPELDLIKMDLDNLSSPDYATLNAPAVAPYFRSYRVINNWEEAQFKETRKKYTAIVAKRLGIPESKVDLRRDANLSFDGSKVLAGSKSIFVPLANGAQPVDKRGLNLKPLAALTREIDEDDESDDDIDPDDEIEDIDDESELTFKEDDLVQTEHGFGYIRAAAEGGQAILKGTAVRVVIPGFNMRNGQPYPVTYPRTVIYKPTPPSSDETSDEYKAWARSVRQLEKDMKKAGRAGITFVKGYVNPSTISVPITPEETTTSRPPPNIKPHPDTENQSRNPRVKVITDEELPTKPERKPQRVLEHLEAPIPPPTRPGRKPKFDLDVAVFNGVPALLAYTDEEGNNLEHLNSIGKWFQVPRFIHGHVRTMRGAKNLVKIIKNQFPATPDARLEIFLQVAAKMQSNTSTDLTIRSGSVARKIGRLAVKNFFLLTHNKTVDDDIKIYPLIYNDELFVAASINNQQSQVRWLRKQQIPGVAKLEPNPPLAVFFADDVKKLGRYLNRISSRDDVRLPNINDAIEALDDPRTHRLSGYSAR